MLSKSVVKIKLLVEVYYFISLSFWTDYTKRDKTVQRETSYPHSRFNTGSSLPGNPQVARNRFSYRLIAYKMKYSRRVQ